MSHVAAAGHSAQAHGAGFGALVRSEFMKVLLPKSTWWLLALGAGLSVLSVLSAAFFLQSDELLGFAGLETAEGVDSVYANAMSSYIVALIIGIMLMSGEFKNGTAVATFLVEPRRARVLFAKLIVGGVVGFVVQGVAYAAGIGAGWLYLGSLTEVTVASPSDETFASTALAALLSGVILGIVGVGLGALVKNQQIAIVSSLIWLLLVEALVVAFAPEIGKFLPTGAITALLALDFGSSELGISTDDFLSPVQAALVLVGYGVAFTVAAIATSLRRDID